MKEQKAECPPVGNRVRVRSVAFLLAPPRPPPTCVRCEPLEIVQRAAAETTRGSDGENLVESAKGPYVRKN